MLSYAKQGSDAAPVEEIAHRRNPHWYVPETEVRVVTGLAQKPYDRIKYYWRLRDHAEFLKRLLLKRG